MPFGAALATQFISINALWSIYDAGLGPFADLPDADRPLSGLCKHMREGGSQVTRPITLPLVTCRIKSCIFCSDGSRCAVRRFPFLNEFEAPHHGSRLTLQGIPTMS